MGYYNNRKGLHCNLEIILHASDTCEHVAMASQATPRRELSRPSELSRRSELSLPLYYTISSERLVSALIEIRLVSALIHLCASKPSALNPEL
jgi:hypothetical protein